MHADLVTLCDLRPFATIVIEALRAFPINEPHRRCAGYARHLALSGGSLDHSTVDKITRMYADQTA